MRKSKRRKCAGRKTLCENPLANFWQLSKKGQSRGAFLIFKVEGVTYKYLFWSHSFQEALTITMNTLKQLRVISGSVKYVSDGLSVNSPPVPVNKDVPLTAVLCKCIDAVIKSEEQLNLEMQALKEVVNQVRLIILWLVSRACQIMLRESLFSLLGCAAFRGAYFRRKAPPLPPPTPLFLLLGSC